MCLAAIEQFTSNWGLWLKALPPSTLNFRIRKNRLSSTGWAALKAPSTQLKYKYIRHLIVAFWAGPFEAGEKRGAGF